MVSSDTGSFPAALVACDVDEDMFTDIRDSFLCDETNAQALEKLTNIGDYLIDKKGDAHDGKKSAGE